MVWTLAQATEPRVLGNANAIYPGYNNTDRLACVRQSILDCDHRGFESDMNIQAAEQYVDFGSNASSVSTADARPCRH